MKVNIANQENEFQDGYDNLNVDAFYQLPDSSCNEILLMGKVDQYGLQFLLKVMSKLRHGGFLVVVGTDLMELCRHVWRELITLKESRTTFSNSSYLCTVNEMANFLTNNGLNIVQINHKGLVYTVRAQRP